MSSGRNSPSSAYPTDRRRSSFSGQIVDMFNNKSASISGPPTVTPAYPGRISGAVAAAQQGRRLSLSTIGLSGSPTSQSSPFTPSSGRPRAESISTSGSYAESIDESPFEDGDAPASSIPSNSPFSRRLSFGARAMRDMRAPSSSSSSAAAGGGGGTGNADSGPSFDIAESFRSRAQRSSISAASGMPAQPGIHQRAKSVSTMEQPAREMPKQPRVPDAIQERMLRGDFYMD